MTHHKFGFSLFTAKLALFYYAVKIIEEDKISIT